MNKRIIISFQNLKKEVIEALNNKYPDGFENHVIKVDKGNGKYFYGVTVDYEDTSYLVKVDVSVDSSIGMEDSTDKNNDIENRNDLLTELKDEPSAEDENTEG